MQTDLFDSDLNLRPKKVTAYSGKHLLNLSEFPLALGSQRIPMGLKQSKTLICEDMITDSSTKLKVRRKQTVVGGDLLGLPTKFDDEVLLALMQFSADAKFTSDTIRYTHYGIAKKLNKGVDGPTLKRIEESIRRWMGVTVYYENAWWNPKGGWESHDFHILESRHKNSMSNDYQIRWNPLVFESMQHGRIGTMDWETFLHLKSSLSRQIYRLLLKRFKSHRSSLPGTDIVEFAQKMGIQESQPGQIKKKLKPSLKELYSCGIIQNDDRSPWFKKVGTKKWSITLKPGIAFSFSDCAIELDDQTSSASFSSLSRQLVKIGISEKAAQRLVKDHPAALIKQQIEYFLFLMDTKGGIKNPAGYLNKAIKDEHSAPMGYKDVASRTADKKDKNEAARREDRLKTLQEEFRIIVAEQKKRAWLIHGALSRKKKQLISDNICGLHSVKPTEIFFEMRVIDYIITEEMGVESFAQCDDTDYIAADGIKGYPDLQEFLTQAD